MKIFNRWYFWALVAFVAIWVLVQTFFPPAQARIKQLMKSGAKAVEHKSADKIMSLLDPEFQLESGMDKETLRLVLSKLFVKYDNIRIVIDDMRVVVEGEKAEVYFSAWAGATVAATITEKMPVRKAGATEDAVAVWRKGKGGWKLLELNHTGLEEEF